MAVSATASAALVMIRAGFDAMSKALPVLWQPRRAGSDLLKPPYSKAQWLLDLIVR